MTRKRLTQAELESYLDEDLPTEKMSEIESALRDDPPLLDILVKINERRDAGVHSVGGIWRRRRISCPAREQLGSYLLETLTDELTDYIRFHLERIGCRVCQANLEDLRQLQQESSEAVSGRRQKYFQSSAGYLRLRE